MHSALYRLPSHATSSVNRVLLRIRPYSLPLGCRSLCTPPPKPSFFTSVSPMRLTFLAFMGVTTYGFIGMVRDEGHDIMAVLRPLLDTSHKAPSEAEVKAKRVAIMEDGIKSARETKPAAKNCFLTIAVNGKTIGTLEIELFDEVSPLTAENFRVLCGVGSKEDAIPTFKGTRFHRIIPRFMIQGGDVTRGDGTGGISIYGRTFADEQFVMKHTSAGLLSMANCGKDTNSSQFFITLVPCPHLDGKHVVFGRVVKGLDVLYEMEKSGSRSGVPNAKVRIVDCGEVKDEDVAAVVAAPTK